MKIGFATTFNAQDVNNWSGTPTHMSHAFTLAGDQIVHFGNLKRHLPSGFKLQQFLKKLTGQRESPRFNETVAKHYSKQVAELLKTASVDAIISPQINPIAFLECKTPLILWTDALYASLLGFYPAFAAHSANSIRQGNTITHACLSHCNLAIFSSDWAARTALEIYGIAKEKIKVVPFGANITCSHTLPDIKQLLTTRPRDRVKLLFIGKNWYRKGGDIVFNVAKALHEMGQPVEVNFVGCQPPDTVDIPAYIHCHGFISKRTPEGQERINQLLRESHFLFVPSRAEAYGIVFCEANAFGLPALTSYVGGISSVVKDNINGMTFSLEASTSVYCDYITHLMQNYAQYEALALSAFHEYETRLNWNAAVTAVKKLIQEM